jgi:hypothetical protein
MSFSLLCLNLSITDVCAARLLTDSLSQSSSYNHQIIVTTKIGHKLHLNVVCYVSRRAQSHCAFSDQEKSKRIYELLTVIFFDHYV